MCMCVSVCVCMSLNNTHQKRVAGHLCVREGDIHGHIKRERGMYLQGT